LFLIFLIEINKNINKNKDLKKKENKKNFL